MTKYEWRKHRLEVGPHDTKSCPECAKRRETKARNARRNERAEVMRSLGMVKTPYGWE